MKHDKAEGRRPKATRVTVATLILFFAALSSADAQTTRAAAKPFPSREKALQIADATVSAGRRDEAKRLLAEAGRRYQSVQALMQLARLQTQDGNARGALDALTKARALAPNSEDVLYAFAQVAMGARLVTPALNTLQPLARMCPDVADYQYLLGVALMQAGDLISSYEALQRSDTLQPNRPLTLSALGLAANSRKMYAEAKQYLLRALEYEPDSIVAAAALAEAEDGLGESAVAETHARRVLAKEPYNATALLVLGLELMNQNKFAEARDAFTRSIAAEPSAPKPYYQLSLAYARLGDQVNSQKWRELYQQKLREMDANVRAIRARTGLPSMGGMGH